MPSFYGISETPISSLLSEISSSTGTASASSTASGVGASIFSSVGTANASSTASGVGSYIGGGSSSGGGGGDSSAGGGGTSSDGGGEGTSSSATATSSSSCGCTVDVALTPMGGTGCGLELSGGIVYGVGDQYIGYNLTDDCNCVNYVRINGEEPPVFVADGDPITVTVNSRCDFCEELEPYCDGGFSFMKRNFTRRGKTIYVNRAAIMRRLKRR